MGPHADNLRGEGTWGLEENADCIAAYLSPYSQLGRPIREMPLAVTPNEFNIEDFEAPVRVRV